MTAVLQPLTPGPPGGPGPAGPAGPPGPSGGHYLHTQNTPVTVWTINHGLGFKPNVTVIDSAGTSVEGQVIYVDDNSLQVAFAVAFGGTATLT